MPVFCDAIGECGGNEAAVEVGCARSDSDFMKVERLCVNAYEVSLFWMKD